MGKVVHFEIHASDPESLVTFYSELFGWEIQRWGEMEYWTIVGGPEEAPGVNGGLLLRRGERPATGQAVNAFVCTVDVESLDSTLAQAQSLGATIALERQPIPGIGWLAYIHDPDGNILGILESDPSAG